ncbi:MAG: hypothetical protein A7315_03455 [Candidatus Altiarchaeales archaeon WOR_SM1_79]|nr:MAG: hypothetical protein A7315_03455 [Candidatus Altiarchaeales archaeon WOR_SM1_79]
MNVKKLLVLLISLFFLSCFICSSVFAGSQDDPEIIDNTGDTDDSGWQFRDIESAWFSETNLTVIISLKLAGPPPNFISWDRDTTTFHYEVYFDVEGSSYAVSVSIQYAFTVGGIYVVDAPWVWELRRVVYAAPTDIIQSEERIGDVNGDYDGNQVILEWEVNKDDIGIGLEWEGRGQMIVSTWTAIWNANENPADSQRNPEEQSWDYANTHHSNPGKSYRITGMGGVDYYVILSADIEEKITYGGTPVEFLVRAFNNGSEPFTVDFFSVYSGEGWSVILSVNSSTIARGATRTITVTVTPPEDVENGTLLIIRIDGSIHEIDGNGTVSIEEPVYLRAIALSPPKEEDKGNLFEDIIEALKNNLIIIAVVIIVLVIAIIVLVVLIKR